MNKSVFLDLIEIASGNDTCDLATHLKETLPEALETIQDERIFIIFILLSHDIPKIYSNILLDLIRLNSDVPIHELASLLSTNSKLQVLEVLDFLMTSNLDDELKSSILFLLLEGFLDRDIHIYANMLIEKYFGSSADFLDDLLANCDLELCNFLYWHRLARLLSLCTQRIGSVEQTSKLSDGPFSDLLRILNSMESASRTADVDLLGKSAIRYQALGEMIDALLT